MTQTQPNKTVEAVKRAMKRPGDYLDFTGDHDDWKAQAAISAMTANGMVGELAKAIVALADGADKCAEAPHYIYQPFVAIYREHGETIAEARALIAKAKAGEALTPIKDRRDGE